jgi:excinuclease UvrABC nuclease subunit
MKLEDFVEVGDILRSGVYALCAKGVVIYVGKSKSMLGRIYSHRQAWQNKKKGTDWISERLGIPGLQFDEVHIRPCPKHEVDALEHEMINKYKPRYNVQLKNSQKVNAPIVLTIKGQSVTLNQRSPTMPVVERRV